MIGKSKLKKLDKKALVELLIELSKLDKKNKLYLESRLTNNHEKYLDDSKKRLEKAFCCFENLSLRDARKVLMEFRKLNPDKEELLELYFYYLDCANDLDKHEWRLQESFYSAIERVFVMVFDILRENKDLFEKYEERLEKTIDNSTEGWWLRDFLDGQIRGLKNEQSKL